MGIVDITGRVVVREAAADGEFAVDDRNVDRATDVAPVTTRGHCRPVDTDTAAEMIEVRATGDVLDYAAHRVGAVESPLRPAHDFDTIEVVGEDLDRASADYEWISMAGASRRIVDVGRNQRRT